VVRLTLDEQLASFPPRAHPAGAGFDLGEDPVDRGGDPFQCLVGDLMADHGMAQAPQRPGRPQARRGNLKDIVRVDHAPQCPVPGVSW
jgi:hypothetical protein